MQKLNTQRGYRRGGQKSFIRANIFKSMRQHIGGAEKDLKTAQATPAKLGPDHRIKMAVEEKKAINRRPYAIDEREGAANGSARPGPGVPNRASNTYTSNYSVAHGSHPGRDDRSLGGSMYFVILLTGADSLEGRRASPCLEKGTRQR